MVEKHWRDQVKGLYKVFPVQLACPITIRYPISLIWLAEIQCDDKEGKYEVASLLLCKVCCGA
jgi:hypothetical protein